MIARLRSRLSYANVASSLALFLALSTGTAYAANEWTGANIVDESLTSVDLATGTIGTTRIKNESVAASDLAPDSVAASEIAANAVGSAEIADESLTSSDLATDSVTATEIADGSIDSGEIVNDSLFAADLAAGSVGTSELASNAVNSSKVANNSLTTADILGADVSGFISLSGIANGRCSQVELGVSGAQVGEVAVIATKAAIQNGILLSAFRVSSAGHVTMNACNFSGTTMTAITDLAVRIITFG